MPIPAFDGILNILPPHIGDPTDPTHLSPFPCSAAEFCDRFATSERRRTILEGFLNLRQELCDLGLSGFQWADGSFVEDVEAAEGRQPGDLDVVTFVRSPLDLHKIRAQIDASKPWLLVRRELKMRYLVDHFLVSLASQPELLVDQSRYWYGLFSHRRDRLWKGMLAIELGDPSDDSKARRILGGKS